MPIPLVVEDNNLPTAPNATNSSEAAAVQEEKEAKVSNGLKILVSNSSNNMMRKPMPQTRPVTENDLYLLNAMEKLVYKMDFMEKRLKRVEEMMYYMMAGNRIDNGKNIIKMASVLRIGYKNCRFFSWAMPRPLRPGGNELLPVRKCGRKGVGLEGRQQDVQKTRRHVGRTGVYRGEPGRGCLHPEIGTIKRYDIILTGLFSSLLSTTLLHSITVTF